ncbi:hypothetical protein ATL31_2939 [Phycicoccus duodecadis]|uniref:Uncharacterized protein n=1 Tax=Phycicoccus duodecadis TaxID=173053 RepID=A0A2N3YMM2_9MICO|nr:hypothetical protein ATL31_2939 [Phycicoccus duodecadis]
MFVVLGLAVLVLYGVMAVRMTVVARSDPPPGRSWSAPTAG